MSSTTPALRKPAHVRSLAGMLHGVADHADQPDCGSHGGMPTGVDDPIQFLRSDAIQVAQRQFVNIAVISVQELAAHPDRRYLLRALAVTGSPLVKGQAEPLPPLRPHLLNARQVRHLMILAAGQVPDQPGNRVGFGIGTVGGDVVSQTVGEVDHELSCAPERIDQKLLRMFSHVSKPYWVWQANGAATRWHGRSLCDDEEMPPRVPAVDAADLTAWCTEHLGSAPAAELFRSGHLSAVVGLRLVDGREVVVKVRPASLRIAACVEVQRRLFESGYPCPEPLGGPARFGNGVATAEAYVPGGDVLPSVEHAAQVSAAAFARLIGLAPRPAEVSSLDPPPSWAAWNHGEAGLWPPPEDGDVDLNEVDGPEWVDCAASAARDRLRAGVSDAVIGHCDWLADNLRWSGDELLVVHDWDSAVADSEAVLVGFAAALYSTVSPNELATVEESDRFLDAYCDARGRPFSADELQRSWAAGVWTRAYDAKDQYAAGHPISWFSESEARERLRRAGID
jgi:Phosphotransferase enzyme family